MLLYASEMYVDSSYFFLDDLGGQRKQRVGLDGVET